MLKKKEWRKWKWGDHDFKILRIAVRKRTEDTPWFTGTSVRKELGLWPSRVTDRLKALTRLGLLTQNTSKKYRLNPKISCLELYFLTQDPRMLDYAGPGNRKWYYIDSKQTKRIDIIYRNLKWAGRIEEWNERYEQRKKSNGKGKKLKR